MAKQMLSEKSYALIDKFPEEVRAMISQSDHIRIADLLILMLKEQDRDTRHACAELIAETRSVALPTETMGKINMIVKDAAHNAIMNCRGGIE